MEYVWKDTEKGTLQKRLRTKAKLSTNKSHIHLSVIVKLGGKQWFDLLSFFFEHIP
jgi:hypothetical protein